MIYYYLWARGRGVRRGGRGRLLASEMRVLFCVADSALMIKSLIAVTLCYAESYITVIAAREMRFWLTRSGNLNPLSISANDEPHGEWEACPQGCREQSRAGLGVLIK